MVNVSILVCVALVAQPMLTAQAVQAFEAFRAHRVMKSNSLLTSMKEVVVERRTAAETLPEFVKRIRSAGAETRNFDADFTIVKWSCGFVCQDGAIVNPSNGKVEFLPFTVTQARNQEGPALDYRIGSRLLITDGCLEWRSSRASSAHKDACGVYFFEWTLGSLREVKMVSTGAK